MSCWHLCIRSERHIACRRGGFIVPLECWWQVSCAQGQGPYLHLRTSVNAATRQEIVEGNNDLHKVDNDMNPLKGNGHDHDAEGHHMKTKYLNGDLHSCTGRGRVGLRMEPERQRPSLLGPWAGQCSSPGIPRGDSVAKRTPTEELGDGQWVSSTLAGEMWKSRHKEPAPCSMLRLFFFALSQRTEWAEKYVFLRCASIKAVSESWCHVLLEIVAGNIQAQQH